MVILPWDYCKLSFPGSATFARGDYKLQRVSAFLDMQADDAIQQLKSMLRPMHHDVTAQAMLLLS
jgi:hypothetical protein